MVRPKTFSPDELAGDLPKSFCDIPTCGQMAELVFQDKDDLWIYFCGKHNPHDLKRVKFKNKKS